MRRAYVSLSMFVPSAALRDIQFESHCSRLTTRVSTGQEDANSSNQKSHGTCMASKICGKTNGVAKQTIVIPVIVGVDFKSFLAGLNQVLAMIPQRRANGEVMSGKTVLAMSLGWPPNVVSVSAANLCQRLLQSIMNLGVIVVNTAGNDALLTVYRTDYPAQLSTPSFPLITVGGVTLDFVQHETSQNADVYAVGREVDCADGKDRNFQNFRKSSGSSAGKQIITKASPFLRSSLSHTG